MGLTRGLEEVFLWNKVLAGHTVQNLPLLEALDEKTRGVMRPMDGYNFDKCHRGKLTSWLMAPAATGASTMWLATNQGL